MNRIKTLWLLVTALLLSVGGEAMAQASAYVAEFEDIATTGTTDITAVVPLALSLFAIVFGVGIVKAVFRRLAK